MLPALQPAPHDEHTRTLITAKREAVAVAEKCLSKSRTIWLEDTLHDIPLHRPDALARAIEEFLAEVK
jgi:hypothetical protein